MTSHTKVWRDIKCWFRSVPPNTNSQGYFEDHPSMNTQVIVQEQSLQTVRQTAGHTDDHLENMTSQTKVWRGIKGWFRSVPQNTNSQGWLVFCGTDGTKKRKEKKRKTDFLKNRTCS